MKNPNKNIIRRLKNAAVHAQQTNQDILEYIRKEYGLGFACHNDFINFRHYLHLVTSRRRRAWMRVAQRAKKENKFVLFTIDCAKCVNRMFGTADLRELPFYSQDMPQYKLMHLEPPF